jgi:hypothetical protein
MIVKVLVRVGPEQQNISSFLTYRSLSTCCRSEFKIFWRYGEVVFVKTRFMGMVLTVLQLSGYCADGSPAEGTPSIKRATHVSIIVKDWDEAAKWYIEKLGFEKRADMKFGVENRWITVAPKEQKELEFVLVKPLPKFHGEEQAAELTKQIGKSAGTTVLVTEDCKKMTEILKKKEVRFISDPEDMPWGVSAVFEDLYGNRYNLLQLRQKQ